jgi:hypothetical protein
MLNRQTRITRKIDRPGLVSTSVFVTAAVVLAMTGCGSQYDRPSGVSGTLVETGGHPIAGMTVVVEGKGINPEMASAETDARGRYWIEQAPAGACAVSVYDRAGEMLFSQSATVSEGEATVFDITVEIAGELARSRIAPPEAGRRLTLEELGARWDTGSDRTVE